MSFPVIDPSGDVAGIDLYARFGSEYIGSDLGIKRVAPCVSLFGCMMMQAAGKAIFLLRMALLFGKGERNYSPDIAGRSSDIDFELARFGTPLRQFRIVET